MSAPTLDATRAPNTGAPLASVTGASASASKKAASWRAVGWSKTRVLGSDTPSPATACSWLRSSTAPSESRPASIKGTSASTLSTTVFLSMSSIHGKVTRGVDAAAKVGCGRLTALTALPWLRNFHGSRKPGTCAACPSITFQSAGNSASTWRGPRATRASTRALCAIDRSIGCMPPWAKRLSAPCRAA